MRHLSGSTFTRAYGPTDNFRRTSSALLLPGQTELSHFPQPVLRKYEDPPRDSPSRVVRGVIGFDTWAPGQSGHHHVPLSEHNIPGPKHSPLDITREL